MKESERVLKVMTYNIHVGIGMDNQLNMDRIIQVLKKIGPDLGGLNEVDYGLPRSGYQDITDEIRKQMGYASVFAQAIQCDVSGRGPGGYGVAAFGRRKLQVMMQFALPVPEDKEPRTALILKTGEKAPLYFIVTHLPWEYDEHTANLRCDCLRRIESVVSENGFYPAVMVGDMNALPDSPAICFLRKNWLVCNDVNPQPSWPSDSPYMQIDYIACYPKEAFRVRSCRVEEEVTASDHRPLVAELERVMPQADNLSWECSESQG